MLRPLGRGPWQRAWLRAVIVVVTVASTWLTFDKLRISGDISTLLPESGDAAALSRWTHAFGVREPAIVLLRGDDPTAVEAAAVRVAAALRDAGSIASVMDRAPAPDPPSDATLAWAYAGPEARARLAAAVTPEGMRVRLRDTRALLLAPAGGVDAEAWLARDPLRLFQVPWETRAELAAGVPATAGAAFAADGGRARLVIAEPRGSAFVSSSAEAVVEDVERAKASVVAAGISGVTIELTGGHAIAWATEQMMRRDLEVSGTLSLLLASVAFVATFRRVRALVAVLPPLVLGTLWTTGLAALLPSGLSAVAIGFAAVVVGVGVDTGVHVYAALLDARRAGLSPGDAARRAREATWQPTLMAAAVAAVAFGSLAFCGLKAVRELGLLCGAGELLTAIAILLVTPEIGGWLERAPPPPPAHARWVDALVSLTGTRTRAWVALLVCASPIAVVAVWGWPRAGSALVALRPRTLEPLVVQERVYTLFGGQPGQWIVLSTDTDEERARTRADAIAEALEPLAKARAIDGYDSLSTFLPSEGTRRARLAVRDGLDLPSRRADFESALRESGFDLDACAGALDAFARPSAGAPRPSGALGSTLSWLTERHVAKDALGTIVATYVRPMRTPPDDARARAAILAADPAAVITGFEAIDAALREVLGRDLVIVGAVALLLVTLAMRLVLRSGRRAFVALAALACEVAVVGVAMKVLGVHWHVYDALVLPVLFGVTIDESMFLLHAARESTMRAALHTQGPLVTATALTTAAGFFALVFCRFDGLRDLGAVGAVGVVAGLLSSLVVVPAALRIIEGERDGLEEPLTAGEENDNSI
jgi:predicted RND superfamily exporter protein